jgi:hypothetical protein
MVVGRSRHANDLVRAALDGDRSPHGALRSAETRGQQIVDNDDACRVGSI